MIKSITVAQLREAIKYLPGDIPIFEEDEDGSVCEIAMTFRKSKLDDQIVLLINTEYDPCHCGSLNKFKNRMPVKLPKLHETYGHKLTRKY